MKTESFLPVPLKKILDSDINRFSLHRDLSDPLPAELLSSIDRFGLFHPPVVLIEQPGKYQLLCGRRRILALQEIGRDQTVLCRVVEIDDSAEMLMTVLEDQRLSGPLSAIMTARFLRLVESQIPVNSRHTFIAQMNIGSYGQLQRQAVFLKLEQPIRDAIHKGMISDKIGLHLCSLTSQDRLFLCNLFMALSLNNNKQKRLLDMCQILLARTGRTVEELFQQDFHDFLPRTTTTNKPQSAGNLMKLLHEASHPMSTSAEKIFNDRRKELRLPTSCRLSHSQSFEKDSVTLSIDFSNFDALKKVWSRIKNNFE